jgi:hypothetical protein
MSHLTHSSFRIDEGHVRAAVAVRLFVLAHIQIVSTKTGRENKLQEPRSIKSTMTTTTAVALPTSIISADALKRLADAAIALAQLTQTPLAHTPLQPTSQPSLLPSTFISNALPRQFHVVSPQQQQQQPIVESTVKFVCNNDDPETDLAVATTATTQTITAPISSNNTKEIFPQRLMAMLNDSTLSDIITWLHHGKSFVIVRPDVFTIHVLPLYLPPIDARSSTKYSSFTRKLNRWYVS